MRVRHGRGLLAAILFGTLLIPAVASLAGPKADLEEAENKLENIQQQIAKDKAEAGTLKERIAALNRSLTRLQIEVARLDTRIADIEYEVRDAQAKIDATQAEIDLVEEKATQQAVTLYKSGTFDTLSALLDSESLTELDERVEMLGVAAQENTGALIKFGRLQVKIRGHRLELFNQRDELAAVLRDRARFLAAQAEERTELDAALTELELRLGKNKSRERHLASEMDDIRQALLEHQAKAAVMALGTSGKGFIWPLNGSITSYYGPRWGRMHTGIDINGTTGQPIVAAKEGTVVLASYYSGYGNAVIVDHGGGYATLYAHMSSFNTSDGDYVEQGDVVGYVGCTGSCTGDHLHFEVRVNGDPVDPMPYLP
jgi:murein DD-endopeptidase MepM/ murein hydrolase activator NlpD